jgi:hypothetical protein
MKTKNFLWIRKDLRGYRKILKGLWREEGGLEYSKATRGWSTQMKG